MPPEILRGCPYISREVVESPVGLLVVRYGARRNAMTVSFFSEVAHHPTAMWVSVARQCFTHQLLQDQTDFTFVALHERQSAVAVACGTVSGRDQDKCAHLDLYESGAGFLFLRGALSSTACRVFRRVPLGDHTLFLASILSGDRLVSRAPLRNLLVSDLRP
jgi:flavin reductase (DIM6/NTAB) family NADH-FMN oxidoreductase RutF